MMAKFYSTKLIAWSCIIPVAVQVQLEQAEDYSLAHIQATVYKYRGGSSWIDYSSRCTTACHTGIMVVIINFAWSHKRSSIMGKYCVC